LTITVISSTACLSDFDWRVAILTLNYMASDTAIACSRVAES